MIKKLLIILFLFSAISFSQDKDTSLTLKKNEYIGVIKGIKYLEAKDSLVINLLSDYDIQIDNYKKLQEQDSVKMFYTQTMLKETKEYNDKLENKLYDCENPPFYNTKIAFTIYGMIIAILIGTAS